MSTVRRDREAAGTPADAGVDELEWVDGDALRKRAAPSVVRFAPSAATATVAALRQCDVPVPDVPMTSVEPRATVFVMNVSTAAIPGIASRQGKPRRVRREEPAPGIILGRPPAARTRLDAYRMEWVRDTVRLHRAPGILHLGLHALSVPPHWQVERHGPALSLSRGRLRRQIRF
jgi:hypothetical protein